VVAVLVLPMLLKADGVWFAITAAELAALVISVCFLAKNRKRYGY
jgi:Na+-driven multidrug efflux pump